MSGEWTTLVEWWTSGSFQHRIDTRPVDGTDRWTVRRLDRGPGGSWTEAWRSTANGRPEVAAVPEVDP